MIDKLSRFTPVTTLNRDEMLFQAGRASVRSPRIWKWLVCGLALSQSATLAAWFWLTPVITNPVVPALVVEETPLLIPETPRALASPTPDPSSYLELSRRMTDDGFPRSVPGPNETGPVSPPLTAGSRLTASHHLNF